MRNGVRRIAGLALASGLTAFAASANAGGPIVLVGFAASTAGIPTLSEWTMILLGALIAFMAIRSIRSARPGQFGAWLVAAGALAVAGGVGPDGIRSAMAVIVTPTARPMSAAIGGNVQIHTPDNYEIRNDLDSAQRIHSITVLDVSATTGPVVGFNPTCTVGLVLSPGSSCYLLVDSSV